MHSKTDSDVPSWATSSPDHNRRPVYYVQSPYDGDKTTPSFHSTPTTVSPPLSHSSVGRHSRESSTSRFSGPLKPCSAKVSANDVGLGKQRDLIEEEEELLGSENGLPRRRYFVGFLVGFSLLFSSFYLILWGVSKSQKPRITMKSIEFERFEVQAGSDNSGVSTDMISVNCTVKFNYENKAKFFGVHVSSTPIALSYSLLKIGSGNIKEFYETRRDDENMSVIVTGDKIPMYGSGEGLSSPTGMPTLSVQLRLDFVVQSIGYVLGKLVEPRFYNKIECSIVFDSRKVDVLISLKNSCTYDR